jgi:hypothetical protein
MSVEIERYDVEKTGRYIVTFKEDVMGANFYQPLFEAASEPIQFAYRWDLVFHGFAGEPALSGICGSHMITLSRTS